MSTKSSIDRSHDSNNFGLLRLLAAYFVLISHSFAVLQRPLDQPALWYDGRNIIFSGVGLGIFFTISGFLVTQSLMNSVSLKHYFSKRFLRIMPALIVANLICIGIGCFVTSLPVSKYLVNIDTWSYLLKNSTLVVNQFELPGVFRQLKDHAINASLWTIFVEVEFYIVLALIAYQVLSRRWLFLCCFVFFEAVRIYVSILNHVQVRGLDLYPIFTFGTYFYLGSLFFCFRDKIQFKWFYANILMAIAFFTVYTIFEAITLSVFFAYCFIIIGTSRSVISLKGYDLSYGIYLYAFPVQQLVVLWLGYGTDPWLHVTISAFLATLLAFLSWIFVEKPFLQLKHRKVFT